MKEALKLALEALQLVSIEFVCNGAHHAKKDRHDWLESCPIVERYQAAITAIKEALAQPEQEPVAWAVVGDGKFGKHEIGQVFVDYEATHIYWENRGYELVPVYTTPPQRTWVGLTATAKLDLLSTSKGVGGRISGDVHLLELLTDHETQLKRKNT